MEKDNEDRRSVIRCEACGTAVPAYDVVNYGSIEGGYRQLCSQCFNAKVASVVIDGRDISWEEFGRMLMTFEGWQFRMEIADRSDEI